MLGNISKYSVFKLYGTPMMLPANNTFEGYLTKESPELLPLPNGKNKDGWMHGYETETKTQLQQPPVCTKTMRKRARVKR